MPLMEEDGLEKSDVLPPNKRSGDRERLNNPNDLGDTSIEPGDIPSEKADFPSFRSRLREDPSLLEAAAVETYANVLLGRALFLFYNSTIDDRDDKLAEGKAVLAESEPFCLANEFAVGPQLVAKWWYTSGLLADMLGENKRAASCFIRATSLDEKYMSLKRVQWHIQRRQDAEELSRMWDDDDDSVVDSYNLCQNKRQVTSNDSSPRVSPFSKEDDEDSLYRVLLEQVSKEEPENRLPNTTEQLKSISGNKSRYSVLPSTSPHGLVAKCIERLRNPDLKGKKVASTTPECPPQAKEDSPKAAASTDLHEKKRRELEKSKQEYEDRKRLIRERQTTYWALLGDPLDEEIPSFDTPSTLSADTPSAMADESAVSRPKRKLAIKTRLSER